MDKNENPGENPDETSNLDSDCAICLDTMVRPLQIQPCLHSFCEECLNRLNQVGRYTCPLCRGAINGTIPNQLLDRTPVVATAFPEYLRPEDTDIMRARLLLLFIWDLLREIIWDPIETGLEIKKCFE